jgi:4-hydroxymandelate oxidase
MRSRHFRMGDKTTFRRRPVFHTLADPAFMILKDDRCTMAVPTRETSLGAGQVSDSSHASITDLIALEEQARQILAPDVWRYLSQGARDGATQDANLAGWRNIALRPRIFRGIEQPDLHQTVLGCPIELPVLVSPNGRATRYHADGEVAMLRGVAGAGSGAILASSVASSLKTLNRLVPNALRWSQLYFDRDRERMGRLLDVAAASECAAVVLTVDLLPDPSRPPPAPPPTASWEDEEPVLPRAQPAYVGATFGDLAWLCRRSPLPVVVKGVLRADDALHCVEAGAAGIVVSNHGGNQLDTTVATATALGPIAQAVGAKAEVYVDGGIRSGVSVLKALALGARAVLVGRPASHGLAVAGADGVALMLHILRCELHRAMALCGIANVADIAPDLLAFGSVAGGHDKTDVHCPDLDISRNASGQVSPIP